MVRLYWLSFRVTREALLLPRFLWPDGVRVRPEGGGDGVVGEVGHHARLLPVLDFPERVAAELSVVALLIDAEAALPFDEDAVFDVGDHLVHGRRSLWPRFELHVRHTQERVVAPVIRKGAAAA